MSVVLIIGAMANCFFESLEDGSPSPLSMTDVETSKLLKSNNKPDRVVTREYRVMSRVSVTLSHMSLLRVNGHRRLVRVFTREASFPSASVSPYRVFDRTAKQTQKDRAANRNGGERSRVVDYVRDEVADRMMERLLVSCPYGLCAKK